MKFSMPILAIVVALLFVASQSVYTVDQRKYAVKFQLGEVVETKTTAGLYFKMPLVQNVKFYDKVNLTLDNPEPDRMTTSEKKPLLVDFVVLWRIIDVRQYYISVQGDEEAARRRLSQTVRANLAEEFNKHDVHEAISSARDAITSVTQQKANADAKSIGVEVIDVRLRRVREDSRGRRSPASGDPRRRLSAGADDQGRRRREVVGDLRAGVRAERRVLFVLPQPRRIQVDIPKQERPDGPRPECRLLPVFQAEWALARTGARYREIDPDHQEQPRAGFAVDGARPAADSRRATAVCRAARLARGLPAAYRAHRRPAALRRRRVDGHRIARSVL